MYHVVTEMIRKISLCSGAKVFTFVCLIVCLISCILTFFTFFVTEHFSYSNASSSKCFVDDNVYILTYANAQIFMSIKFLKSNSWTDFW